jgi:hypothetical protein
LGSPAFLKRSIYHARKSLTRLNIRNSDISKAGFVQISLSCSMPGTYLLWKFENLGVFHVSATAPPKPVSMFFSRSVPKMRVCLSWDFKSG